jgi:hypothetical protein
MYILPSFDPYSTWFYGLIPEFVDNFSPRRCHIKNYGRDSKPQYRYWNYLCSPPRSNDFSGFKFEVPYYLEEAWAQ